MGKAPCCSKVGLHKGPWSTKEDMLLTNYIHTHGEGQWRSLPKKAGLLRCGKSCRLRWVNYLRPGIKRGNISADEEDLIIRLHSLLGNRWSLIAGRLPGRTDNEIKNHFNTHLIKRLKIQPKSNPKQSKKKKKTKTKTKTNNSGNDDSMATKIKVYVPKPIRVSPVISRNNSVDSSTHCSSSHEEEVNKEEAKVPQAESHSDVEANAEMSYFDWPSIDLGAGDCRTAQQLYEEVDQVLLEGCRFEFEESIPAISNTMLETVYEEYLQLLQ